MTTDISKSGYDVWRDNNLFFDTLYEYYYDVDHGASLDAYDKDFLSMVLDWEKWREEHIK